MNKENIVVIGMPGVGKSTRTINSDASFRKVPKPEAFDHIFTDEEINIIESVIKERK